MKRLLLALKLVKGVGNKALIDSINRGVISDSLITMPSSDLYNQFLFLRTNAAREISENFKECVSKANNILKDCDANGIKILAYNDKEYPDLVKKISDPPAILFYRGDVGILQDLNAIAVIGTRDCTEAGGKIASKVAQHFAKKKFVIVSGLAKGIDTFAHQGALEAKGKTIAVLTDIQKISPKENIKLAEEIVAKGGLLIAENEPGIAVKPYHFVARDRIQSALSLGVFPIETDVEGGTMHTVEYAQKQNKLLFCPDPKKSKVGEYDNDIPQIRGIRKLIDEKVAVPFTGKDYAKIEKLLKCREKQLQF